jgi:NTP pyrophosphatase (non-canonical NTP hydrolase)
MCKECNDGTLSVALHRLTDEILENNQRLGWEPDPKRTFGDEIALLHSEVSEAFEAFRQWGLDDKTGPEEHHLGCAKVMLGATEACNCPIPPPKPEGVGSEFADIFIRLLHYSRVHDIDLIAETRRKMNYNKTREYRHGGKNL